MLIIQKSVVISYPESVQFNWVLGAVAIAYPSRYYRVYDNGCSQVDWTLEGEQDPKDLCRPRGNTLE